MAEKGKFSKERNAGEAIQIKEDEAISPRELIPQGGSNIVPVTEFAKPLVTAEEAVAAFKQYQELVKALVNEGDLVTITGKTAKDKSKTVIKKSGMNKISKFFGISVEVIRAYKELIEVKKDVWGHANGRSFVKLKVGDTGFVWRVWAKATAPNGQFRVAGAACSSLERSFAHEDHDVYATSETRAKKRAIEELAGMGEYELMEDEVPVVEDKPKKQDKLVK